MPTRDQLQSIIDDPGSTAEERAAARSRLNSAAIGEEPPTFSPRAQEMLRALGKTHIRDVSEDEWLRYIQQRGLTLRDPLVMERAEWVLPDERFMELTGWTPRTYWRWVLDRATSPQVRENALKELGLLEGSDGQ